MHVLAALLLTSANPTVSIDAPVGGWTTERIVTVTGSVSDAAPLGVLVVNGVERPQPFVGGRFEATFALGRGVNAIEVIAPALDAAASPARARVVVTAQIPKVDLQVLLFWDTDQTDVDLHVREPGGKHVYYGDRESDVSGGRLDRDDVDGYGPEIYSATSAPSGVYEVSAHYFGDRGSGQTTATVMVVAREGTTEEQRWRFVVPLTRQGEEAVLARIDLPPPGLRLERPDANLAKSVTTVRDSALPFARGDDH
jgi:uncharacterized protein YfaP (DUF2135 family)